jgi:lipopolysaccharide/colanic/teichoic acid biosynthesis glycosyltransferase
METLGWSRARPAVAPNLNADPENGDESLFELKDGASLSRRRYAFAKRATDVAAAAGLLIALGPLVMLISLLIVIEIGLPVVFWQQRPGRYGRPFKLYKFRTMLPAHDRDGKRIPEELRSSRVGGFLRRSRLDELPQLYNILVGEMSLVGPRPLLPIDQPQTHAIRLLARPGLTGWAQINGGREISNEDKTALDIWYIVHSSMWLDTKILLRTIGIMVSGDRVNTLAVEAAHFGLEELRRKATGEAADRAPVSCKPIAADEAA